MIVDSSVLIAIAYREPDYELFERKLSEAPVRFISAATLVESIVVVARRSGEAGLSRLHGILKYFVIDVVEFDERQAEFAQEAVLRFGKGVHPAKLNFGDCFSYALARSFGQPLLFKGDDFSQTDILKA